MKKLFTAVALVLCVAAASAQEANYGQAARFSQKRIRQMVHSTRIRPNWFRDSDRFWYSWTTADGTRYYIVDPATGSKTEVFDMDRLARELTEITRDPYNFDFLAIRERYDERELKDALMDTFHEKLPEELITDYLIHGTVDASDEYLAVMEKAARAYASGVFRILREHEYNPRAMGLYIVGGGGCIIRNFADYDKRRVAFNDDICATAKGYEVLAKSTLNMRNEHGS